MHDPHPVRRMDGPGQVLDQRRRLLGRQWSPVDLAVQTAAGTILECEEWLAIMLGDFVDLDDVRVTEPGDGLGFGAETREIGFTGMAARQEHLEGDRSIEAQLPGFVDDAHAPATEFSQDLISANIHVAASRERTGCRRLRRHGDRLRCRI